MNNTDKIEFIASLESKSIRPTAQEVMALTESLHAATINLPEFLWVTKSFEDVAEAMADREAFKADMAKRTLDMDEFGYAGDCLINYGGRS